MTGEHCDVIGKQPEIINLLKEYGIIISCAPNLIEREVADWIRDYGPQMNDFFLPFKTWIEEGVQVVGQHWGNGGRRPGTRNFKPPFYILWQAITRKYDGQIWQPEERIDRAHALKMWTRWAAEYVRKPDQLGSLEVGKFADLLIIDRDYFTIPEEDILKIHPLMTMVGGKIVVLQRALAADLGMEPIGPQKDFTDKDVAHIGLPLTEISKMYPGTAPSAGGE
jgi:predicted amidohydrolase YtcJ